MAITYETAKKLKDAGFPQHEFCECFDMEVCTPSLEELIEACPKTFNGYAFDLICVEKDNIWIAWYEPPNREIATKSQTREGLGQSPAEAVAALWLSLNKKV